MWGENITIKHNKVSTFADGDNPDLILPSDWNDSHSIIVELIPDATDLDTYITTGIFHQNITAQAVAGSNYPVPVAGFLEVIQNENVVYQKYIRYDSPFTVYTRIKNSTWSSWVQVWNDTNDGPDSGLNADLLDGEEGSYYLPESSYTAEDILTKIKTVDGSGSGLDADLLDGQEITKILSQKTNIPASADLNNYDVTGLYHQPSTTDATSGSNYPVALAGMLEVIQDGSMVYQKYTSYDSSHNVYVRTCYNSTWYSWYRLLNSIDSTIINSKLNSSDYTAADVLAKLLGVDGSGSGLDADLLDGVQYSTIQTNINAKLASSVYTAADVLAKLLTVDGPSSGLNADLLDGQHGAYYLPTATYTAADVLTKIKTVDGAGSGLDADLLDGANPSATGGTANAIVKARAGGTIDPNYLPGFASVDGTFRLPKLVERKTISSGSPVTYTDFTGLNGNVDEEYILKYNIYKNGTGDIPFILQFNGDTGYNYAGQVKSFIDNNGSVIEDPASLSEQVLRVGETKWNAVNWLSGKMTIEPVTGKPRWVRGSSSFYATQAQSGFNTFSGFWNNTVSNITSIRFKNTSSNTFYGTVELLKLVDLVIS
ncbi:MAG: pyocin knob domain-containing protein [Desulfosporosinus sp.]